MHYVIVGNGVCGIEAALALPKQEPDSRIGIVSEEHEHFFSRPSLMYVFCKQVTLQGTEPHDRGLYESPETPGRPLGFHDEPLPAAPDRGPGEAHPSASSFWRNRQRDYVHKS
jgi:hypothetical protein